MNTKLFSILAFAIIFVSTVNSQSPPQPERAAHVQNVQPQSSQPHPSDQGTGPSNYNYRSAPSAPSGTGSNNYQTYPVASPNYNRGGEPYGTGRDASAGNPIFGVQSNADFQLSAYFGQIFWGFVAVTLTLVVSIWIIRYFAGTDVVGGLVDKIRDSSATGKALDLDRLTNVVYQAFETYGKWAAKDAIEGGLKSR